MQSLVEDYANLKAQRKLEGDDLAELPAKSDTPQMTITLGAGEQTVDLTVDQLNSVADVYYSTTNPAQPTRSGAATWRR